MPRDDDLVRLHHILDAAHEALEHAANRKREDLDTDRQLLHSLVRCIEIIGEAASNVTPALRAEHPEVPWLRIIGMRNRLIHGYFDINHAIVWKTVHEELPTLVSQVREILGDQHRS